MSTDFKIIPPPALYFKGGQLGTLFSGVSQLYDSVESQDDAPEVECSISCYIDDGERENCILNRYSDVQHTQVDQIQGKTHG